MTSKRTRVRLVERLKQEGLRDARVLEAILSTPRHLFVDEALASRAYEDTALPIGFGQTISQPYIVARMTELVLEGGAPRSVLEVGTGCGYQTAILAQLVPQVFTVDRIHALSQQARRRFRSLGLGNIRSRHGDGYKGWPGQAPFDAILVTAAPERIPQALIDQLADGGRLILPVGVQGRQHLSTVLRRGRSVEHTIHEPVSFVPMQGGVQ